ncbi:alpha/beta hydrolase, partial [Lishizhenia sp.]|uniref:alpha/beta hydrolase n=1 Tax=Lishizhenia sp. TaxID=2497594 RepID=UPI00299E2403
IVVGIANVDRQRDFTFDPELEEFSTAVPNGGHSKDFIAFLEKELIPFVEYKYRASNQRYLVGQSLGGLVATEILLYKPQLFHHYFIVSPSIWWDQERLLVEGKAHLEKEELPRSVHVEIFVGKKEPFIMRRDARRLKRLLKRKTKHKVNFTLMRKEDHATILHNSIYRAFVNMFEPRY